MQYLCIARESDSNFIIDSSQLKDITGTDLIKNNFNFDYPLWERLASLCYPIDMDKPLLQECHEVLLDYKPGPFSQEKNSLVQLRPNLVSKENIIFLFKVIHTTKWNIPDFPIEYPVDLIDEQNIEQFLAYATEKYKTFFVPSEVFVSGEPLENTTPMSTLLAISRNSTIGISVNFKPEYLKKIGTRDNVLREILETEKTYVSDLKFLDEYYRVKMVERNLLTEEESEFVFKDVSSIRSTHRQFFKLLKHNYQNYATLLTIPFMEYYENFKVSVPFISSYDHIESYLVKKKNQDKVFQQELSKLESEKPATSNSSRDIFSYLITIIQRLPRYSMFLKTIRSSTPWTHPDRFYLEGAEDCVARANRFADETLMKDRMQQEVFNLQQKIGNSVDLISNPANRFFLKMTVTLPSTNFKSTQIYLLTDYILITAENGSKTLCIMTTPTASFHVFDTDDPSSFVFISFTRDQDGVYKSRKETIVTFKNKDELQTFRTEVNKVQELICNSFISTHSYRVLTWRREIVESLPALCQHSEVSLFYKGIYKRPALPESHTSKSSGNSFRSSISIDAMISRGSDYVFADGPSNNLILFFGGEGSSQHFTAFDLDIGSITLIPSSITARRKHTLTRVGNFLYLIGGVSQMREYFDIRRYSLETDQWSPSALGDDFQPRFGHTAIAHKGLIYIYGGHNTQKGNIDELIVFNPSEPSLKKLYISNDSPSPPPRYGHSAVVFRNSMYVFGGKGTSELLADLWALDLQTLKWREIPIRHFLSEMSDKHAQNRSRNLSDEKYLYGQNFTDFEVTGRWHHQAVMIGSDMVIVKGATDSGPAASFCVDLESYAVKPVLELGNSPFALSQFSLSEIKLGEIMTYGGRELRAKNPTAAVYYLSASDEWKKIAQKKIESEAEAEELRPTSRYEKQMKRMEIAPEIDESLELPKFDRNEALPGEKIGQKESLIVKQTFTRNLQEIPKLPSKDERERFGYKLIDEGRVKEKEMRILPIPRLSDEKLIEVDSKNLERNPGVDQLKEYKPEKSFNPVYMKKLRRFHKGKVDEKRITVSRAEQLSKFF